MNLLLEFLVKNGYKSTHENDFKSKVKEYFGVSEFSKEEEVLFFNHPKGYDIDTKEQFINTYEVELYFIQEMKILEQGIKNEDNNRFICYNKIVFNDDNPSITQILHDKKAVEDLVIYFDYESNLMMLNFALNYLDINNKEILYLEHLIFYNDKSKENVLKVHILLKLLEKEEDFFIEILQSLVENWDAYTAFAKDKYHAVAFMLEELLKKNEVQMELSDNKAYLILNNLYVEKENLAKHLLDKNYFGYRYLKKYSETYHLLYENDINDEKIHLSSLRIYDRADFSSFSKEIESKGEIEYLSKVSGWDYIKINGMTGYLPTQEQNQELAKTEKRKYNFLVEDEPEPQKKRGFWDNLFG